MLKNFILVTLRNLRRNTLYSVINISGLSFSLRNNQNQVGKTVKVLVEGFSKKSENDLSGRDESNSVVVFPKGNAKKGNYVLVKINDCTSSTLIGEIINS